MITVNQLRNPNPNYLQTWELGTDNTEGWTVFSYRIDTGIPLFHLPKPILINLMNISPQVKNHSQGLKVNRKVNHLIPPYKQTTPQEQKRFEKSRQLPIVPILQPTPEQLLQQNIEKIRQVVKPKPRTKSSTKSKTTTTQQPTTKPKRSKEDLKKQKEEMLDWLNNVKIQ